MRILAPILLYVGLMAPGSATANGWEHGAIPFEALIEALDFHEAPTRQKAAESLGYRGQKEAVPHLLDVLQRPEPSPSVRGAIYLALGALGDARALPALDACLEIETRNELRADCAQALGGVGTNTARETLIELIGGKNPILVKARAVEALGHIGGDRSVLALAAVAGGSSYVPDRMPDELSELSSLSGAALSPRAITALGRTGHELAGLVLAGVLADARRPRDQARAVTALIAAPSQQAEPALRDIIESDADDRLRAAATVALTAAANRGSLASVLSDLLDDPAPLVQFQAIRELQTVGDPTTAPALVRYAEQLTANILQRGEIDLLADPARFLGEASLLEAAIRALTELDPESATPIFEKAGKSRQITSTSAAALAIKSAIYQLRRSALYGLAYTQSNEAWALLSGSDGIGDPDKRLRAVAARSLAVLGSAGTAEVLSRLLSSDPSAEVRWAAADALGPLGDQSAIPMLMASLSDKDARVRESSARALAYLPSEKAKEALQDAADRDESKRVREAAAFALQRIEAN